MSKTIRIRTTPNGSDKYIKVPIEQDFDFIEVLSLRISQEEAYRNFCADYGVIVGRVIINSGFGVPNAKVSVFIPIDDIDKDDPLISGLYPYEVVTDKNIDGIRYNLLSKKPETDNVCFTPVGTLPDKREIIDNEVLNKIYCKYYKFTTTTNHAGDFMIFGVPVGTYTVHIDADISDIGIASQRPYDLINQGASEKLFESTTKFKGGTNLDKLPQIKTANIGVNVRPFWGDTETCEIGITRVDFDLNYTLTPNAIFMGSIFGDQDKNSINKNCRPRRKLGRLCEQETGQGTINMIRKTIDDSIEQFDIEGGQLIDDNGTWAYQIPMNLDYVVTDEFGNLQLTQDPNVGIPTRARVRFKVGLEDNGGEGRVRTRAKYLVPNNPQNQSEIDYEFGPDTKDSSFRDLYWNKIYTVSNFISRYQKQGAGPSDRNASGIKNVDNCVGDKTPFPYNRIDSDANPIFTVLCIIIKIIGQIIWGLNNLILPIANFLFFLFAYIVNSILVYAINLIFFVFIVILYFVLTIITIIMSIISALLQFTGVGAPLANKIDALIDKDKNKCSDPNTKPKSLWCLFYTIEDNFPLKQIIDSDGIGCITITCGEDSPKVYAPGCNDKNVIERMIFNKVTQGILRAIAYILYLILSPIINLFAFILGNPGLVFDVDVYPVNWKTTWQNANQKKPIDFYPGKGCPKGIDGVFNLCNLDECIAFQIAKALGLFEFDFYNDWVNGSLYSYLLKYKKIKRNKKEKFCDNDCDTPDSLNNCNNLKFVDTCLNCTGPSIYTVACSLGGLTGGGFDDCQVYDKTLSFREGVVKKYKDGLYYAATTRNANHKLFATEIISLGSVFDCDWQGQPKIQQLLLSTTYKMPPDFSEYDDNNNLIQTGIIDLNNKKDGLFFAINCCGIHVDSRQCANIRHVCEYGVTADEQVTDPVTNTIISPNGIIGSNDIDSDFGIDFRNNFTLFNKPYPLTLTPDTTFNKNNTTPFSVDSFSENGKEYVEFRGFNPSDYQTSFSQPKHSYYFYFGTVPGKSAVEKLIKKYFVTCPVTQTSTFIIQSTSTPATNQALNNGVITFSFVGVNSPFTYTVTGPNNYNNTGTVQGSNQVVLNGLVQGQYLISGTDSLGYPITKQVTIGGPTPLYSIVNVTKNVSSALVSDGEITISSIGGGIPPYSYNLKNGLGGIISNSNNVTTPLILSNLAVDNTIGYSLTVTDSSTPQQINITSGLTVTGPTSIALTTTKVDEQCFGIGNGSMLININGGTQPYYVETLGPNNFFSTSQNIQNLVSGTYTTNVVDANNTSATTTTIINTLNPQLTIVSGTQQELLKQCNPNQYTLTFRITAGLNPNTTAYVEYTLDGGPWIQTTMPYVNSTTPMTLTIPSNQVNTNIRIRFSNTPNYTCISNAIQIIIGVNTQLPVAPLNANIIVSGSPTTRTVSTPSGGFAPYNGSPFNVGFSIVTNTPITTTITDSVGCTKTITG
jgi:hypothetical protein